jgi:putative transposase
MGRNGLMEKNRQTFSPKFKAETILEVLREQKTMSQIAADRSVHTTQLTSWKKTVMDGLSTLFEKEDSGQLAQLQVEHEKQLEQLYAEIGKLTTQLNWLEKKSGRAIK